MFNDALERLNLRQMMPLISTAYLVDGYFCGSLIFDPRSKQFMDTLLHDALQCQIVPSPLWNIDPVIRVTVGAATQQFLSESSPYAQRYLQEMPEQYRRMLTAGEFVLDPVSTLFVGRRTLTDRAYTSYLHRILPMYLIEKTMFRGTLVEAQRRQRAITHITAGDDQWTPSPQELLSLIQQFQAAEQDPQGGWITTRNAVQAVDIRPGGDFWKWTDMADVLVPYKLRALGISESFLSGDASYAAAESAYSTFLESQNSYRSHLTDQVFYRKIFPLVAVINGLYKDGKSHSKPGKVLDFLFNSNDRANLKTPKLNWDKSLEPKGEEGMFDLLEKASEKGVPIPLRMWMAASNIDRDRLLRDLKEDKELRRELSAYTGKDTSHEGEDEAGEDEDYGVEASLLKDSAYVPIGQFGQLPTSQRIGNAIYRKPLLARNFGNASEVYEMNKSGSGKKWVTNQVAAQRKQNEQIIKIARNARDPNYRAQLSARNEQRLGSATIPLAGGVLPSRSGKIKPRTSNR